MPRRSGKLPASEGGLFNYLQSLVPGEEPPALFNIEWRKVERAYNKPLPADVREAMVAATTFFVLSEKSERTGEPVRRVRTTIEVCKRRASEFQRVLPSFELKDGLQAIFFIAKNYSDARLNDGRLFVALQGFLTAFQLACDAALKEISEFPAVKEGDEWRSWISELNRIAKDNGLPFEVRKDAGNKSKSDKPSPFTSLVKELQSCLPRECRRRHTHSAGALAVAISRALGSNKRATPFK
jgi:hypothetical protein